MATTEKIGIPLPQARAPLVCQAVESWEPAASSEVMCDVLENWQMQDSLPQQQMAALRQLWQEGIRSGSAGVLDMEEVKREARAIVRRND